MDIVVNSRTIHLPYEILDLMVGYIKHDRSTLLRVRLANKCLGTCATKALLAVDTISPSELFIPGKLPMVQLSKTKDRDDYRGRDGGIVTIWTWLRLPMEPGLVDQDFTKHFKDLFIAPVNGDRVATTHRLGTCWARMSDDPEKVALGAQFWGYHGLRMYQSSEEAAQFRDYLEKVSPGCLKTSTSRRWRLRHHPRGGPLRGDEFAQIKTLYFKVDSILAARAIVEKREGVLWPTVQVPFGHIPERPTRGWLRGLYEHQGQLAIALQFILRWRSEENRLRQLPAIGPDEDLRTLDDSANCLRIFEHYIKDAGWIGDESHPCRLEGGPRR